jgi:hypothetical protein
VRAGDYLLTVGDVAVKEAQFGARLRAKFGASIEGSPLPIRVRRGSETMTLGGKLRFGPGDLMVERDPGAGAKAIRIRNGILKGTTG